MNSDTKTFLIGVVGSLAAAALVWLGTDLAGAIPQENGLYYTIAVNRVGPLTTWNLEFINDSDTAIDEFRLQPPSHALFRAAFEPPSVQSGNDASPQAWSGQLLRGEKLKALFVFDSADIAFSQEQFRPLIIAKSSTRDKDGRLFLTDVSVQLGLPPTISRLLKQIGMFLIPMLVAGVIVLGVIYFPRRKPKVP